MKAMSLRNSKDRHSQCKGRCQEAMLKEGRQGEKPSVKHGGGFQNDSDPKHAWGTSPEDYFTRKLF